jgi:SAM-dependent methyltransferase
MHRSAEKEILETQQLPDPVVERAYRDLTRIHRALGDIRFVADALRRDPLPVKRVMDIGCGHGGVLLELQKQLGIEPIGIDLNPPRSASIPILRADATRDPLPQADVAISLNTAHHLTEPELTDLIRNAGRYCRRFLLVDLVRHRLPLILFSSFVAPFISELNVADGCLSIRRAYTPPEFRAVVQRAIQGSNSTFRHSVAPFYVRQSADIRYR